MEPTAYISRLEEENEQLRDKVSDLSQEVETLKYELQIKDHNVKDSGEKYILAGKNKIYVNEIKHMKPIGSLAKQYESDDTVKLLICKNCLTCGVNNWHNMFIRKTDRRGNKDFCRHCQTENSFYYVSGYWYTTTQIVQKIVKKKRLFSGKIYDDLEEEKVKIGKWKFVHERS